MALVDTHRRLNCFFFSHFPRRPRCQARRNVSRSLWHVADSVLQELAVTYKILERVLG